MQQYIKCYNSILEDLNEGAPIAKKIFALNFAEYSNYQQQGYNQYSQPPPATGQDTSYPPPSTGGSSYNQYSQPPPNSGSSYSNYNSYSSSGQDYQSQTQGSYSSQNSYSGGGSGDSSSNYGSSYGNSGGGGGGYNRNSGSYSGGSYFLHTPYN